MSDLHTALTSYGCWNTLTDGTAPEDDVCQYLGAVEDDYDVDAIVREYREAVDAALPRGVELYGDEFTGPYDARKELRPLIRPAVESIDLGAIVSRHELDA